MSKRWYSAAPSRATAAPRPISGKITTMTTATTLDARGEAFAVVQPPLQTCVQRIDDDAERDRPRKSAA